MIFESLWPLALLLAVPVVIILYLLRPKGRDQRISSILLWDRLLRNQQSKTFLEKFIHNILMYLQIVIILVLVLALMSPYLRTQGKSRGNVILVFDTSASMQHDAGTGSQRIEEAVKQAKSLIAASEGSAFSIVTSDCRGTELLAVGVRDRGSLYELLDRVECCDGQGDLQSAEGVVETLRSSQEAAKDAQQTEIIVFTDGNGAEEAQYFSAYLDAQVMVIGEAVNNVANHFLSYAESSTEIDEGEAEASVGKMIICASSLTNYSDTAASLEISLYVGDRLQEIKELTLEAGESTLCFYDAFTWQGEPLRSEVGSVSFAGSSYGDSLTGDNTAYAVADRTVQIQAAMVGEGNTYIEKAYQAATGTSLTKLHSEGMDADGQAEDPQMAQTVRIYDAGMGEAPREDVSAMIFGDERGAEGTAERVLLTVSDCDLTAGLTSFSIGVNETKVYELPSWGIGFLWAGEQCAGYYGEHDGVKTVVVGFDIRESDFPLKAEFPIFISNALQYLSDTSLLAANVYQAGAQVLFHPQADIDVNTLIARTDKAGLYEINAGAFTEQYVVRFATDSQSDGRQTAEGTVRDSAYSSQLVRRQLRNVLLVLALLLLMLEWILYVRQMRCRSSFYLAVRLICAGMLLLALFGVTINRRHGTNTTIFLIDISNSNAQNLEAMEGFVDRALDRMPGRDQYGIVTFGKDSLVEQFLTGENHFSHIMSLPDKTATNIEEAISRALAMLPAEGAGRVVILTDGRETRGNLLSTASALSSRQIELLAMVYETEQGPDAYVERVELPSYLYQGDAYSMTVTVESNYETDAQLQIWAGTMQTAAYDVHLSKGSNRFQLRQEVTGESVENFEVRVVAAGDTCAENDGYHAYSVIDSVPKVLVVTGMEEDGSHYRELLDSANCNINAMSAINAPDTLEELLEYKSIVLENVYLSDLPEGFLQNIEIYVKDYGCGLICCGGEESYALGGYRGSVLETALPVDMMLRGVNEVPSMAMIMVIDRSGSMVMDAGDGISTNLDLAITAVCSAVDLMQDNDYVGVLCFDTEYSWVVEPTIAADKEKIKAQIEGIDEGGGTTIQPALWEALEGAEQCDASVRHVVLLTDGQGEGGSYRELTEKYKDSGVTLSTVAVGVDSDTVLLRQLAKDCNGRYYYSDLAMDIPKIFAQEVFLGGDTYLQNGVFGLAVNGSHEITRGLFEDGWPSILGYVSASPKSVSNVLIASEKQDPILTVMQYGLGHTVAWNTDVTNQWTAGFAGQEDYAQLWRRIVDYSVGRTGIGEDRAEVMTAGGSTIVTYQALDYSEKTQVEVVYTDPDGNTMTKPLQATAPGSFEARLDTDITGIYQLSVRRVDDGTIANAVTTAAAVQYSDEYKFDVDNIAFKGFVERYGRMLEPEENFWQRRKNVGRERYALAGWLIMLAILWFVLDIALRRFHFRPQDTRLYRSVRNRWQHRKVAEKTREMQTQSPAWDGDIAGQETESAAPASEVREVKPEKVRKKQRKPEVQSLDTSALLKKKDQRSQ
ncbi:MAG: VWA domain-containing protein [bacterium]|nr:VWA domain-containing protein [bacterium]MCM1375678.1 VWA domain-containing protein [Muribaculum sp.]